MAMQQQQQLQRHGSRGTRVWVKQGLDSHRSAQVLLVPLGNIPPAAYSKYCDILRRFSTIPMQNLTAPGDWNRQNSALKHFNWSEGCFNFHFIDADTTDGGASEWEDYQAYRRIMGAIGVVHFPSCQGVADFKELERQFRAVVSDYKHVHAKRIFAFGHSFEHGAYPHILDPQRDIVFPPEQEFEDGGSTTELHMAVSLYDVAVSLIKTLAADVKTWNATSQLNPSAAGRAVAVFRGSNADLPSLTSRYDREEGVSESKLAKRRPGRLHKWIGDTCLLAGSPKDALEHYSQSMSETKASSDPLWYVGCLEGYAACLVAMSDADHPMVHGDQALALLRDMAKDKDLEKAGQATSSTWTVLAEAVVTEKCAEALSVLSRYPALGSLEVELCFKTARFHACAQPEPRWSEALEMLLRALSVPDMSMQVQLERSIEAAILCEGMGLKRKAALLAHLSAMLCSDFETWQTAHLLARMAAEGYGVSSAAPFSSLSLPPDTDPAVRRGGSAGGGEEQLAAAAGPAGGWLVLRKHLLQWLLAVSARCGDARASSAYFAGLTGLMATLEGERRKADRYLVTLPVLPSDTFNQGGDPSSPVPTVIEAQGNVVPSGPAPPMGAGHTKENSKISWSERMMRRATATTSAGDVQLSSFPPTPEQVVSSAVAISSDTFLSAGHGRIPVPAPGSPVHGRLDDSMLAAQTSKKSRKIFLPKSIGRKGTPPKIVPARSTRDLLTVASSSPRQTDAGTNSMSGGGGGGGSVSSTAAVAHRAALTREEQWETLVEMAQCTARLSPEDSARVQLPGIPRLESARLLHFDGALALLPGDGSAASSSSSSSSATAAPSSTFFYNPFDTGAAAGGGGGGRRGLEDDMDDEDGDYGDDDVANDFSGGEVESVRAVVEGVRVQAFPTRVLLPPKAEFHEVVMFVKPLEDGQLVLKGVSVEVLSLVTLSKVDKWGRGLFQSSSALPPPRTYKILVTAFRRSATRDKNALTLTAETVDIQAAAAEAAAEAELSSSDHSATAAAGRSESRGSDEEGEGELGGSRQGEGEEISGAAKLGDGRGAGDDGDDEIDSGEVKMPSTALGGVAQCDGGGGGGGAEQGGEAGDGKDEGGSSGEQKEEEEEDGEEFVPDPYMRRDETACRKLRVEAAAPLLRMVRSSLPTSEALAGEETEEVLELVNGGGGPDVGVMEVWTKPCLSKTQQQQLKSSQPPPMTLLYSLSTGAGAGTTSSDQAAGHPVGLAALEVLLGSKAVGVVGGTEGRVLPSGAGIKLALLRCAGMAEEGAGGGRDGTVVSATEVLVKYSAKVGGAYHRQLRLPVRLAVRGGLRVCSLRVAQFLGGGLRLDKDTDATECLLLLEVANDSAFPIFMWRPSTKVHRGEIVNEEGDLSGGGVTEVPGGSRRCLSLRIPRLQVGPEGKGENADGPRSPLAVRPLFEWEKALSRHLYNQLGLRWMTDASEAMVMGSRAAAELGGLGEAVGCSSRPNMSLVAAGGAFTSGRRGILAVALDQLGDDGYQRGAPSQQLQLPGAVPACLMGTLLPPVRLTCLPFSFTDPSRMAVAGAPAVLGGVGGSGGGEGGTDRFKGFPKLGNTAISEVEVDREAAGDGLEGIEGAWAAKTRVDSFLPLSLVVHNPSPWPVEVEVEVSSEIEGCEHTDRRAGAEQVGDERVAGEIAVSDGGGGSCGQGHVMWSGMPSRKLGKVSPGSSVRHGLVACFLKPGEISVTFTCRVKVEGPSAPYGIANATASTTPGVSFGSGDECSGWHPVLCHRPLTVSVLAENEANAAGLAQAQVFRTGGRIGGLPAVTNQEKEGRGTR